MRRFNYGATQRPTYNRPGVPFGQYGYGAPGPTREVKLAAPIVPEMFLENTAEPLQKTYFVDSHQTSNGGETNAPQLQDLKAKTIIDLRDII